MHQVKGFAMLIPWLLTMSAVLFLLFWSFFSVLARVAGVLLVIDSVASLALFPERAPAAHFGWLVAGFLLWLAGHWVWGLKHGQWRSGLAMWIFQSTALRRLVPHRLR
jgi:hypothetical protein